MSITFTTLAAITSAAMAYVPMQWPNGLHLPGGMFVSATNACLALLIATILLGLLTIVAAWWERKSPPPGGPPPALPAVGSGDQPRPLGKTGVWGWAAMPALFGAGAGQAIPSHVGMEWQIAAAFLCPLFAGIAAYLIWVRLRARRPEILSEATLD
ncbi:MAG TPA: hypothetical protein VN685_08025 [Rhizomicrobium sp.]|nr:hypothetical protein [Rhizomicrobium sp.]